MYDCRRKEKLSISNTHWFSSTNFISPLPVVFRHYNTVSSSYFDLIACIDGLQVLQYQRPILPIQIASSINLIIEAISSENGSLPSKVQALLPLLLLKEDWFCPRWSQSTDRQTGHCPWLFTHGRMQSSWNMWSHGVTMTSSLGLKSSKQIGHLLPSSSSCAFLVASEAPFLARSL